MIERPLYLARLVQSQNNGFPKVITGIRRCGKSYLLTKIFKDYLISHGVSEDNIFVIGLDQVENAKYRDPVELNKYVKSFADKRGGCYVFIDEIQLVYSIVNPELTEGKHVLATKKDKQIISFVDVILGLSLDKKIDLYVTGSNSKMLSSDIITEFRDKATEIHLSPLSFKEFYEYARLPKDRAFYEYMLHGGMPLAVLKDASEKETYLKKLFTTTYFKDILERSHFQKSEALDEICNILSSCIGQYFNAQRIANTFKSVSKTTIDKETVDLYVKSFIDAFIIRSATRYDIKGRKHIGATRKYYFSDVGLRNARLNFSSFDRGQLMENIIHNELLYHDYNVSVGTFDNIEKDKNGKSIRKTYEVDFYVTKGNETMYIQSCVSMSDAKAKARETRPFDLLKDAHKKVITISDPVPEIVDENGYRIVNIVDFLLSL
ncbi:MAG: ATP-binding protein [Bacteroidia bacterium]|nr:ATP-binding protein [Bacteroidia bacterium]